LQIGAFEGMVNKSGKYARETAKATSKKTFYEVPLHDGRKGIDNYTS
jgi:hypothetical protein